MTKVFYPDVPTRALALRVVSAAVLRAKALQLCLIIVFSAHEAFWGTPEISDRLTVRGLLITGHANISKIAAALIICLLPWRAAWRTAVIPWPRSFDMRLYRSQSRPVFLRHPLDEFFAHLVDEFLIPLRLVEAPHLASDSVTPAIAWATGFLPLFACPIDVFTAYDHNHLVWQMVILLISAMAFDMAGHRCRSISGRYPSDMLMGEAARWWSHSWRYVQWIGVTHLWSHALGLRVEDAISATIILALLPHEVLTPRLASLRTE